jgi:acetylornithine deacetylase
MTQAVLDRTIALLGQLVAFPSISADGNRAVTEFLADALRASGARVQVFPDATGLQANLFATLGPEGAGGVVLSGHTDVVPVADQAWTDDPFTMVQRDGRLYGRGTCDMKGFVAACVAMAPLWAARDLQAPIHFAFTHDEETGCFGAQTLTALMAAQGMQPAAAIIGEPTDMQIIDGHKGCNEYTTIVTGLEGHGSAPERGVNALEIAARIALHLTELRARLRDRAPVDCPFDPPFTTINLGALHAGSVANIIPGRAVLDWEMRPVQASDTGFVRDELTRFIDTLLPAMRAIAPDATITTQVVAEIAGLVPVADNPARDLVAALTGANSAGLVPFGTEAGLYQGIGVPSVICGPGSIAQAHKPDEYLDISQLAQCLTMLNSLGARLERGPL